MAELSLEEIIKEGIEQALKEPVADGKSITEWAAIGMKAPRWISVKDRLPEKDGDYLARLRHGGMKVMGFTHDLRKVDDYQFKRKKPGWYEYDSEWGFCERNDITHYMPLPEPPKEEIECNTD